jgi:uncharacterized protein (TIGR03435 family)
MDTMAFLRLAGEGNSVYAGRAFRGAYNPPMNMKSLLTGAAAVIALSGTAVHAQDLTGTWQGTLQAGRELRIVLKISSADGGGLRAVMYSIDQGGTGIAASAVAVQDGTLRVTLAAMSSSYEGKLDAGTGSIAGTWTQGGGSLPLNLKRATPDTAWAIPEPPAALKPMAADASPSFEVATIKPSKPDTPGKLFAVRGRQFSTVNTTLADLLTFAYGLHARQITGGPAWLDTEKYDLSGQPDGDGQPNEKQWKGMIQKLLAERFSLSFHRDKKELPVYALVVDKSGQKLTKSEGDPNGLPSLMFPRLGVLPARNASMTDLAGVMQAAVLDRPVVDQTALAGRYDFTLTWTPDESQFSGLGARVPAPSGDPAAPPGLSTAMQEQLGLRLESARAPVEVLVIDKVEKPSDN